MDNVKIVKHLATLTVDAGESNWKMELNLVQWYDNDPVIDIRRWSPDHEKCSKGITMSEDELASLAGVLMNAVDNGHINLDMIQEISEEG